MCITLKQLKTIWFILLTFFMIYSPPILPINVKHIIGIGSIFWIIINWRYYKYVLKNKTVKRVLVLFSLLPIYVFLIAVANGEKLTIVSFYLYVCVDLLPFAIILSSYLSYFKENYIYKIVIICSAIEAIMVYLSFFNESIQMFFVGIMVETYGDIFEKLSDKRMFGFADSLTFSSAVVQGVISWIYILWVRKKNIASVMFFLFILLSGVINARTTIVAFFIGLMVYIIFAQRSLVEKMVIISFGGGALALIAYYCMLEFEDNLTMKWINEGINEIIDMTQGDTSTGYFSYVTDLGNYLLPANIEDRILGTGKRVFGGENMFFSSDIGFINDIWIGGYFFTIMLFAVYEYVFFEMAKSENDIASFLGRFMMVLYPILDVKGQVYMISDITCMIIIVFMVDLGRKIYNGKNKTIN